MRLAQRPSFPFTLPTVNTMSTSTPKQARVAVTQAEPAWLDLDASVEKTCSLITEAAANAAQLVAFPECWIPGYPAWIWARPVDPALSTQYMHNSLQIDSPQMSRIQESAAANKIVVVLGFSENIHNSLYISQVILSSEGKVLTSRKKVKATHMERTIFGDSPGDCLNSVVDTPVGRVGALSCWEHIQPLLKYHTYAQREQIHIAGWPPLYPYAGEASLFSMSKEGGAAISQTYAIESQSFVLHSTTLLTQKGLDRMAIPNGGQMDTPGGGNAAVFAPDGRQLTTDLPGDEEGIVYADLDFDEICRARAFVDVCGHYSRPDLLWLGVSDGIQQHVRAAKQ
ncbi:carbon-nitrogen hydrolase [Aspergillus aurantiobrunneus]